MGRAVQSELWRGQVEQALVSSLCGAGVSPGADPVFPQGGNSTLLHIKVSDAAE